MDRLLLITSFIELCLAGGAACLFTFGTVCGVTVSTFFDFSGDMYDQKLAESRLRTLMVL